LDYLNPDSILMVAIVKEREMHRDAFEVDMMPSVVGQRSVVYAKGKQADKRALVRRKKVRHKSRKVSVEGKWCVTPDSLCSFRCLVPLRTVSRGPMPSSDGRESWER
jgi:hypothetical protein